MARVVVDERKKKKKGRTHNSGWSIKNKQKKPLQTRKRHVTCFAAVKALVNNKFNPAIKMSGLE